MPNTIITPKFRASYCHVFEPQPARDPKTREPKLKDGKPVLEYSIQALFPKDADLSGLKAAAAAAVKAKWGDDAPRKLRSPFRTEKEDGSTPVGLEEGGVFMSFKTLDKPDVVNGSNQYITDPVDFYSGCWARACLTAKAYGGPGIPPGVAFYLQSLQKIADGEPLGRVRVKAADAFEPIAGAGGSDDGAGSMFD